MTLIIPKEKIRILLVSSTPSDTTPLKVDKEFKKIKEVLSYSDNLDKYEIIQEGAIQLSDLYRHLNSFKPNILHFSGHGTADGIYLRDDNNEKILVDSLNLAKLFNKHSKNLECIILNSCFSEKQARIISGSVSYVIGTNKEIKDDAAIKFSIGIYEGIKNGYSYEESFDLGKIRVGIEDNQESNKFHIYIDSNKAKYLIPFNRKHKLTKEKILILITIALFIFSLLSEFNVISNISRELSPLISILIMVFSLFGISSLDKLSPVTWRYFNKLSTFLKKKNILYFYVVFIVFPLSFVSFNAVNTQYSDYIYYKNITIIDSKLKKGNYSLTTSKLIKNTIRINSNKTDLYEIIASKYNSLRTDLESEKFRVFSTFFIESIFSEYLRSKNLKKTLEEANYWRIDNHQDDYLFDPLLFLMQMYAESSTLKNISRGEALQIIKSMIDFYGATPKRNVFLLLMEMESGKYSFEIESINIFKKKLINILNDNMGDISFYGSHIFQSAWDLLAEIEIGLCSLEKDKKTLHINNISKYYSMVLKSRVDTLRNKKSNSIWLSSPRKFTLYWHIVRWNNSTMSDIPEESLRIRLTEYEKGCPGYQEYLKESLSKYGDFINRNYISYWHNGSF